MIFVNGDAGYLGLALMVWGMVVIADLGFRSKKTLHVVLFFSISGSLLAAVATVITMSFAEWTPVLYLVMVLVGSILVLKGIHDVRSVKYLLKKEQSFF